MPRKMSRPDGKPQAKDVFIPVYIPTNDGVGGLELGKGSLKSGTLVIEFNNNLPSVAIQRMLARGELLGLSFVMVAAEEEPSQEEKDARDLELLKSDEPMTPGDIDGA